MIMFAGQELVGHKYYVVNIRMNPGDLGFSCVSRPRIYSIMVKRCLSVVTHADFQAVYEQIIAGFSSLGGSLELPALLSASEAELLEEECQSRRHRGIVGDLSTPTSNWEYLCLG